MKNLKDIITEKLKINKDVNFKTIAVPESKSELKEILYDRFNKAKKIDGTNSLTLDVSGIDISNINDLSNLFLSNKLDKYQLGMIREIVGLEEWDVSHVSHMSGLFQELGVKTLDLSSWDVSEVEYMGFMFKNCHALEEIKGIDKWNTKKVKTFTAMFDHCSHLVEIDLSKWNTEKVEMCLDMFNNCRELRSVGDISNWNLSSMKSVESMFIHCPKLTLDLSKWRLTYLGTHIIYHMINSFSEKVKI